EDAGENTPADQADESNGEAISADAGETVSASPQHVPVQLLVHPSLQGEIGVPAASLSGGDGMGLLPSVAEQMEGYLRRYYQMGASLGGIQDARADRLND